MFDNEFFQGGLLLAIIAYIGAYLRHLPALAWNCPDGHRPTFSDLNISTDKVIVEANLVLETQEAR